MRKRVPDRQLRRRAAAAARDDAVLLVGVGDDQVGDRPPVEVADHAVALVDALARRAAVARQRHPAGVDQDPALVGAMPDHRGEHRERDVVLPADVDARHHQVEEHEHAGAHLGDAVELVRASGGRRRADAHHGRGKARAPQRFGRPDRARALLFGDRFDFRDARAAVGSARMRENARRHGAAAGDGASDGGKPRGVVRLHAGAVAVGVDFDQHRESRRCRCARLDAVDEQRELRAARARAPARARACARSKPTA